MVKNSVVDRNVISNLALDTYVIVKDSFILDELKTVRLKQFITKSIGRCLGAILLIILLPLFLGMLPFYRLARKQVLCLPASHEAYMWKSFDWLSFVSKREGKKKEAATTTIKGSFKELAETQLHFLLALPLLINIVRGEVHFVGVPPRTSLEVEALPADWKNLYLQSKVGWITLADLEKTAPVNQDDLYAHEAYYIARVSLAYDIKLFFLWLKKKIFRG